MKVIIQNRHYFTTFLLTSESKCNFRATNPALDCDLLCLNELQILLILISRVATWSQCHPCPRGRIVAGNFSSNMAAAISGLGRLVKASLTIGAVSINFQGHAPPPWYRRHHHIHRAKQVRLAFCTWGTCENDCKVFKVVRVLQHLPISDNQTLHIWIVSFSTVNAALTSNYIIIFIILLILLKSKILLMKIL